MSRFSSWVRRGEGGRPKKMGERNSEAILGLRAAPSVTLEFLEVRIANGPGWHIGILSAVSAAEGW